MCHWLQQALRDEGFSWKAECQVSVPFGEMRGPLSSGAGHILPHADVGSMLGSVAGRPVPLLSLKNSPVLSDGACNLPAREGSQCPGGTNHLESFSAPGEQVKGLLLHGPQEKVQGRSRSCSLGLRSDSGLGKLPLQDPTRSSLLKASSSFPKPGAKPTVFPSTQSKLEAGEVWLLHSTGLHIFQRQSCTSFSCKVFT